MRATNPVSAPLLRLNTVLAPKINSLANLVVADPLLALENCGGVGVPISQGGTLAVGVGDHDVYGSRGLGRSRGSN